MPQVIERWSGRKGRFDYKLRAWTSQRVYEVAYCGDEFAARSALEGLSPPVKINSPHPLNQTLVCTSIEPESIGLNYFAVKVAYAIPPGGDATASDDPLGQPIEIDWEPGVWTEGSEIDAKGTPILNMAGDPFDPPEPMDWPTQTLVVVKWEPFYDPVGAVAYQGAINTDQFTISGPAQNIIVPAGQCRCMGIRPKSAYTLNAKFNEVVYRFSFRPNQTDISGVQADAWDIRKLNQGYNGWYTDPQSNKPTRARLNMPDGTECTQPLLLDETGKPILTGVTVGKGRWSPIANPNPPRAGTDVYVETQNIGGSKQVFLHYDRGKFLPFSGLL